MPRWLLEPYAREFVNTPSQSWWMNDLANDTRRIYVNQDHKNIDNTHFPQGDSVGFWAGDHLIVHTINVWPNDYFRGYPPTSNQFESVEVYHRETRPNGASWDGPDGIRRSRPPWSGSAHGSGARWRSWP